MFAFARCSSVIVSAVCNCMFCVFLLVVVFFCDCVFCAGLMYSFVLLFLMCVLCCCCVLSVVV